eukprot:TRINITY_DN21145_c0_g1_i1.p1 TRINITY_DN21145_c0_g1~~TRINITY_DN21145_c0_g1_i1.p1  ORF type:complete len:261 (-),score=42.86 TRINITY_DN21145_c0_g1_i1:307-1089(-)
MMRGRQALLAAVRSVVARSSFSFSKPFPEVLGATHSKLTLNFVLSYQLEFGTRKGVSTSTKNNAEESSMSPVASPFMQVPSESSQKIGKDVDRKRVVQAVVKGIKQSHRKVNLVAALVRGMRVEDALLQMKVTVKKAAKFVHDAIHSARANAVNNHGLNGDRLIVAEAYVGKGFCLKRISYHGKGKHGIMVRPRCRLTVKVRELTPEEEAKIPKIAKLRASRYKKLPKRERRLVPHKVIDTQWDWYRNTRDRAHTKSVAS